MRQLTAVVITLIATLGAGRASGQTGQAACDRACLRTMLDGYLNAVVKHDPLQSPVLVEIKDGFSPQPHSQVECLNKPRSMAFFIGSIA